MSAISEVSLSEGCRLSRRTKARDAFTLVELMIVVTIVAILALVAIPLYSQNTIGSIMSEGVSGAGTIKTAERVYFSQNGAYGSLAQLVTANLIGATDLNGKYFMQADYQAVGGATFLITVTANATAKAAQGQTYIVDNTGAETGTWKTGQ
jgi:prepilin-type N-terminal cleavage/methylation domain-containing protein